MWKATPLKFGLTRQIVARRHYSTPPDSGDNGDKHRTQTIIVFHKKSNHTCPSLFLFLFGQSGVPATLHLHGKRSASLPNPQALPGLLCTRSATLHSEKVLQCFHIASQSKLTASMSSNIFAWRTCPCLLLRSQEWWLGVPVRHLTSESSCFPFQAHFTGSFAPVRPPSTLKKSFHVFTQALHYRQSGCHQLRCQRVALDKSLSASPFVKGGRRSTYSCRSEIARA